MKPLGSHTLWRENCATSIFKGVSSTTHTLSSLGMSGQTGSGKTYTMLGNSSDLTSAAGEGTAGLIPRICVELFQRFGLASGGSVDAAENSFRGSGRASVQVSFCEVGKKKDFARRLRCVCFCGREKQPP